MQDPQVAQQRSEIDELSQLAAPHNCQLRRAQAADAAALSRVRHDWLPKIHLQPGTALLD